MPPDLTQRIDAWAKDNGEESRSEAMRQLLERGLAAPKRKGR
jgi:metal-responsive CopG/Arc/MetJ family transcriptional regulator